MSFRTLGHTKCKTCFAPHSVKVQVSLSIFFFFKDAMSGSLQVLTTYGAFLKSFLLLLFPQILQTCAWSSRAIQKPTIIRW